MLPWQRRAREHKRQLQIRAFAGALIVYACTVSLFLFSVRRPKERVHLNVYRAGAGMTSPVLFMQNQSSAGKSKSGKVGSSAGIKKTVQQQKKSIEKKPTPKPAVKPVAKPVAKQKPSKPKAPEKKKIEPKKNQLKKIDDKSKQKTVEKKAPVKQPEKSKPVFKEPEQKKAVVKKIEPAKEAPEVVPEKIAEQKREQKVEPKVEPVDTQATEEQHDLYVGQGYDQNSKAHMALSMAIGRTWKPPHGLGDNLSSKLSVEIAASGKIQEVVLEKKSGVLAHDMSAKAALWRVEYPREFWGKTISIVFGPDAR